MLPNWKITFQSFLPYIIYNNNIEKKIMKNSRSCENIPSSYSFIGSVNYRKVTFLRKLFYNASQANIHMDYVRLCYLATDLA